MNEPSQRIPRTLAVIHVNNVVMFPYLMLPLVVTEEPLKQVIDHALASDKLLGFFLVDDSKSGGELQEYGTAVTILRMLRNNEGSISLLLQGVSRIRIERVVQSDPFTMVEVEPLTEDKRGTSRITALRKITIELLEKVLAETPDANRDLIAGLRQVKPSSRVADIVAGNINLPLLQKQELLNTLDVKSRFQKLNRFLAQLVRQMRMENKIRNNIQLEMDEDQRRYYLHEQLHAIKKELGEYDEVDQETDKWKKEIAKADLPDYVEEVALEELARLGMMSPAGSEYSVVRNYLEWIVLLPWHRYSTDRLNLPRIDQILTSDHYGLDKPKERVLEFIAVKKLKDSLNGPILCFVGPPGVGKTSLGRSIARAMKRKFIRLSLGGIHDEAEIRGHRRTYIGAMPGKIINEIKRAGTANPVFMLDEVDKLGRDFRGDPASALLEVLDPEQNNSFMDNYLNLPFDLSEVMFITTANSLGTIPAPLRDRMEIIEFSSYIEEEKIQIARHYLVPRETRDNGLSGRHVRVMTSALREIIRYYVREAGVRGLQRRIGAVMRKIARRVAENDKHLHTITADNLKDYLGRRKFSYELAGREPEVGVATGMAWTSVGGEILFCEASQASGKGKLVLTGLLGEVMKESARIAITLVRSRAESLGFAAIDFDKTDIHIHLPSGAVPKDGPSAGVTLTTALVSLFSRRKVRHDIAMTGEITLLGKVLPIGGVREKILAAKRAGISQVILPAENRDEFEEIKANIREGVEPQFVKTVDDVLTLVLL
ncbi:MAG: endopeptidase La [Candidatus Cloacimonetes bacterium]|nr:endopeptidase La [Candidatus Cloacimonadota bacterium]